MNVTRLLSYREFHGVYSLCYDFRRLIYETKASLLDDNLCLFSMSVVICYLTNLLTGSRWVLGFVHQIRFLPGLMFPSSREFCLEKTRKLLCILSEFNLLDTVCKRKNMSKVVGWTNVVYSKCSIFFFQSIPVLFSFLCGVTAIFLVSNIFLHYCC